MHNKRFAGNCFMKIGLPLLLAVMLNACVFTPVVDERVVDGCTLKTKRWTIKTWSAVTERDIKDQCRGDVANVLCAVAALVGTGTAVVSGIVSGSVYLVGNSVHWLEAQGKCDDGLLNRARKSFADPLEDDGAIAINNDEQLKMIIREKSQTGSISF